MRRAKLDMLGSKFGRLTVTGVAGRTGYWVCECECGRSIETRGTRLRKEITRSCGCLRSTHGHSGKHKISPTYLSWKAMKARCDNSQVKSHGARGIKYDPRWADFNHFLEDMGERPAGTSLDRMNVFNGYSKRNCRWATDIEQANNKRNSETLYFDFENYGPEGTPAEWARTLRAVTKNQGWTVRQLKTVLKTMTLDQLVCALDPHGLTPGELRRRREAAREDKLRNEAHAMIDSVFGIRERSCPTCGREN